MLEQRGCPTFTGEAELRERNRLIEHAEATLRSQAEELAGARVAAAALPIIDANEAEATRAGRVRGKLALLEERHARLVARLEALRSGAPLDGDGADDADDYDDAGPLPEEVGRG